jgi:hypothetical protein
MARAVAASEARRAGQFVSFRFLGVTPASSGGRALLESVCRQVARHYGADENTIPTEYRELSQEFPNRLAIATEQDRLVLFLDALDQLSETDPACSLSWLPPELPPNVRLIVSTLPGVHLAQLERKLPARNILQLGPLTLTEGQDLLKMWLGDAGRALQPEQAKEVLGKFVPNGLPLYLKLAFEEARRWHSYTPPVSLAADVPGIIRAWFARLSLDTHHGAVVVSKSLGYLAAASHGLTEDELLDVLSRDREVLADFRSRARHTPPDERLPVIVWSRLYFDLEPYLNEHSADGTSLLGFYHRQLHEAVEADYLAGDDGRLRHAALADYFAEQDLYEQRTHTPNLRKLSELAYQQTLGQQWERLHATLTDFNFLAAKCTHAASAVATGVPTPIHGGVYELQQDFRRALEHFPAT